MIWLKWIVIFLIIFILFKIPYKKIGKFFYWVSIDIKYYIKTGKKAFKEFGLTMFCGRQGGGKTISMVEYLECMRNKYPKLIIVTNFGYKYETRPMKSWRDFTEIRNGLDGVIFAIDELQNEFSCTDWKDFPENLLMQITMQRKQRIKIVATSQVFTRVVKQLREQCYEVVECNTLLERWTFQRCFDAEEYNAVIENPDRKRKLRRKWRKSFVQDDYIRSLFDSYQVIEQMRQKQFIFRNER